MKTCVECKHKMIVKTDKTKDGLSYQYHSCPQCGEEILDMKQLHKIADKYRKMKRYHVKLSNWGMSLGLRIPKELVAAYKLKSSDEMQIIAEKDCIKLIPQH